ncbi:MAG: E3 binding domain-containing protein, partial [Treponema sp.]|nr:E3 binding domain-containing protein [Treponema sp.]
MAHVLIMPRQGNTVESCIIGEWKIKEGDTVNAQTPVCVVETDKATFEIPAGADGTVLKILHPSGDDVPVLKPIMVIGNSGENWEAAIPDLKDAEKQKTQTEKKSENPSSAGSASHADLQINADKTEEEITAISPRAKKLALAEAVNPADLGSGSGPGGRIIEQDIRAFLANRPPLTVAAKDELRRRIADGLSGRISGVGTGIGGRITAAGLDSGTRVKPDTANIADEYKDTPIKGIRKIIEHQMMKSHTTTAAFTLNSGAVAVKLQELRQRFKNSDPAFGLNKITVNDLVL